MGQEHSLAQLSLAVHLGRAERSQGNLRHSVRRFLDIGIAI